MLRSEISDAVEMDSFAMSFMHLVLRREHKEDYTEVGGSTARWGMDYRIVNKITCSLEGGYGLFQRYVHLDVKKQGTGPA